MEHGSSSGSSSLFASVVGIGVGVGLGLVSARLTGSTAGGGDDRGPTAAEVEVELRRLVVDGRDTGVSFDDFPYYISEELRLALTSTAYPYLNQTVLPDRIPVLAEASRTILLGGISEPCLHSLAKALAHKFDARLLTLDVLALATRIHHKFGVTNTLAEIQMPEKSDSTLDRVCDWIDSFNFMRKKAEPTGSSHNEKGLLDLRTSDCRNKDTSSVRVQVSLVPPAKDDEDSDSSEEYEYIPPSWNIDEKILMQSLYKIIVSISEDSPFILYIRDVNLFLAYSERAYSLFQKMLNKLSGRVLIIGSQFLNGDQNTDHVDEDVSHLFPYILQTKPPKGEAQLEKWKTQMETDAAKMETELFSRIVTDVLSANNLECDDLSALSRDDYDAIKNNLFEIVPPAVSYHLMNDKDPEYRNGKLIISSTSLSHGLRIFQESNLGKDTVVKKDESTQVKDNEYEKRIRESVIPAGQIGVTFDDIGALDDIKESIQELVMLPLQRPDLFNGGLLKPCRGILLFGPPGTGKTMLAKAIADEAGASFINISFSSFASKWYGDGEKSIRALFSLARKIAPAIIFLDEVDSMLGTRTNSSEHEVSRRIKTEFMTHWDGLLSKSNEKVLVLAATNRPFDLDEAIIRRFEHRIMVGLPTLESRELILKKLLSKEKVENIDFKELARLTEGYSGSDLKNLCVTAAYRPVRELLQKEKEKKVRPRSNKLVKDKQVVVKDEQAESSQKGGKDKVKGEQAEKPPKQGSGKEKAKSEKRKADEVAEGETEGAIALRPLNMEDLKHAKDQISASCAIEGPAMNDIKQWNELYGKGGSRKKQQLTYFL
ncbi:hypothetical protein EJB05_17777 [Eragrostis curvula]|uniref:AAA+ ATPase domain-containing protein n=1 Tax=Eragrostis curvula TaxID=38414 RepID=A0A5J9VLE8_9POAL|nr:hypothetical protein EJB05_17777 [Eragrostis curvula]